MPPILIPLKGHLGCGKSTIGRLLASKLGASLIDKDDAKDCLTSLTCCSDKEINALSYDIMFKFASTQLSVGTHVIVDCPLAHRWLFDRAVELSRGFDGGGRMVVVECVAGDAALWRDRLERRVERDAGSRACHKPQSWDQLQCVVAGYGGADKWTEAVREQLGDAFIRVDTTTKTTELHVERIIGVLVKLGWWVKA